MISFQSVQAGREPKSAIDLLLRRDEEAARLSAMSESAAAAELDAPGPYFAAGFEPDHDRLGRYVLLMVRCSAGERELVGAGPYR